MKKILFLIISLIYCVNSYAALTAEDMTLGEMVEAQKKLKEEKRKEKDLQQQEDIKKELKRISVAIDRIKAELSNNISQSTKVSSDINSLEKRQDSISKRLEKEIESFNQTTSSILRMGNVPSEMLVMQDTLSLQQKRSGILSVFKKQLANKVAESKKTLIELVENLEEQKQKRLELSKIKKRLKEKESELQAIKDQQRKILNLPAEIRLNMRKEALLLAQDLNLNKFLSKIRKREIVAKTTLSGIKLPIIGKITKDYHSKDRITELPIQGIIIEGGSRGKIKAMHDGRVIYSGLFREYGHLVILEHQTGAHSLYAGFGKAMVDVGDYVNSGDLLGFLPIEEEPTLYYEVRINNISQNPKTWLSKDLNKA